MTVSIADTRIRRITVVEDHSVARKSVCNLLREIEFEPFPCDEPLPPLEEFVLETINKSDAALCDHSLTESNYADFSGAVAVASLYRSGFPAILCTRFAVSQLSTIRTHRHRIPVLIPNLAEDPDRILRGFELCRNEIRGVFTPSRKAVKTLLRVERIEGTQLIDVVMPAWRSEAVPIPLAMIPPVVASKIQHGSRLSARVNIESEDPIDLYFTDFEFLK